MIAVRDWPIYRPPVPTVNTGTYHDVIREADTGYYGYGDGAVDAQELQRYSQRLNQQMQLIQYMQQWFGTSGYFGSYLNQLAQQVRDKQTAVAVMQEHHGTMTDAGDPNWSSISHADIDAVARRDGNAGSISGADVQAPVYPPPPVHIQEQEAVRVLRDNFGRIDANRDGILSNAEIHQFRRNNGLVNALHGQALSELTAKSHELMFASIDPGNAAWFGLSAADLGVLDERLGQGETLDAIGDERRATIGRQRSVTSDEVGFWSYVSRVRRSLA